MVVLCLLKIGGHKITVLKYYLSTTIFKLISSNFFSILTYVYQNFDFLVRDFEMCNLLSRGISIEKKMK